MDKIREALEEIAHNGLQAYCSDKCLCAARDMRHIAQNALSAPVASDARELAEKVREYTLTGRYDSYFSFDVGSNEAAALIERFAAERERKAREDERETCANRAEIFYRSDCGGCGEFESIHAGCIGAIESGHPVLTKHAYGCSHIKMLRDAIKEATE